MATQGNDAAKLAAKPLRFVTNYGAPHAKRRRIGAACLTCRKRKTACSGERPICETCKQNRVECAGYAPEASDAKAPPQRKRNKSDAASVHSTIDPDLSSPADARRQSVTSPARPRSPHNGSALPTVSEPGRQSLLSGSRNRMPYFRWLGPTAIMPGFKQMVVKVKRQDTDGANSSVEGTSLVSPPRNGSLDHRTPNLDALVLNLPFYDSSPVPPSELITHLAETFFAHLGCNFPFLPQERFLRDLQEKQVDAILVDAVCALAARFSTHALLTDQPSNGDVKIGAAEYGHAFAQRAKAALTETFVMPTIAAAQAALLLAYNEFGESRDSGLWIYLGLAIRMAQDLGLQKLEGLKFKGSSGPTPKSVKLQCGLKTGKTVRATPVDEVSLRTSRHDSSALDQEDIEGQMAGEQERTDTFWAIFFLDRVVSSGTGRRSTLRDKDIEISFPPLDQPDAKTGWPAPFPALIRIVHLYGGVADLLNSIKEPSDMNPDTSKRLAAMESQVTSFYQGLSKKLHFDAVNFQHYVKAGEGTNFVLLHFWFHTLIVLLHQPTLLKTFEGRLLQLFPNSQQLSMSSAKTIADILSYSQLIDAKASLGNPFTTQPIYIAACAFLREAAEHSASSTAHSRATSPSRQANADTVSGAPNGDAGRQFPPQMGARSGASTPARRALSKHTLLATAANQHYQLCYKALQSLETCWAGTKYILTVLDQKFEGVGDPVLYTAEESECAMEPPTKDPAFTTPGWRRNSRLASNAGLAEIEHRIWAGLRNTEGSDAAKAIGWTMTGTMNSPSTNLAFHFPSTFDSSQPTIRPEQTASHTGAVQGTFGADAMSDASLLLGLHQPFNPSMDVTQPAQHPSVYDNQPLQIQQAQDTAGSSMYQNTSIGPRTTITPGGMWIGTQDVDMSMLGLDMPWFDPMFPASNGDMPLYDLPLQGNGFVTHQNEHDQQYCAPQDGE